MNRIDAETAKQIVSATAEKLKNQTQDPRSEAALRRLIESTASGTPNYDDMSPMLADLVRKQLPRLQPGLAFLGPVQSLQFIGIGAQGQNVFSVKHANGASHWQISLDASGKIVMATVTQGP
jgi:hypothetical protein